MDTIQIRTFRGEATTSKFFYASGKHIKPGETAEVEDASIFDQELIEVVKPKRGRAAKDENATAE